MAHLIFSKISLPANPIAWGVGSLCNLAGGYAAFSDYMAGSSTDDLHCDTMALRRDVNKALSQLDIR